MSDKILKNELKKLVQNSGFEKSTKMSCSLAKILKMRHKDIGREQNISCGCSSSVEVGLNGKQYYRQNKQHYVLLV